MQHTALLILNTPKEAVSALINLFGLCVSLKCPFLEGALTLTDQAEFKASHTKGEAKQRR
jgi:hypothetical protein